MPNAQVQSDSPWLLGEVLDASEEGHQLFKDSRHRLYGFVIAWWKDGKGKPPSHYFDTERCWKMFEDPTCSEDPKQWKTLKRTLQAIQELRQEYNTDQIGLVFWSHPEIDFKKLPFCVRLLEGNLFPGSPTQ